MPSLVAITGAAGYIGGRLLARFRDESDIEAVVGIDVNPLPDAGGRFIPCRQDIRDPSLAATLTRYRVDTLVHTAFVLFPPPRRLRAMAEINVGGTENVLRAACQAEVHHVIFLSSTTVYGAWPDNPLPLTEESPPRPNPDYPYAVHKARAEALVRRFGEEHPDRVWTILRPPGVVGPHFQGPLARFLRSSRSVIIDGGRAPGQFIHEDDLVALILAVIQARAGGIFNATPDDWVPWREMWTAAGRVVLNFPWAVAYPLFGALWWFGFLEHVTHPGQVRLARYPFVASNRKARQTLDWTPRHSTLSALRAFYQKGGPP
ncbi:MAG: NAD-dependent epimerase/dehydratase family protein [Anaerolineae bacterium]